MCGVQITCCRVTNLQSKDFKKVRNHLVILTELGIESATVVRDVWLLQNRRTPLGEYGANLMRAVRAERALLGENL